MSACCDRTCKLGDGHGNDHESVFCRSDKDCASGKYCNGIGCVSHSADFTATHIECQTDSACGQDAICVQNVCIPHISGLQCNADADCLIGQSCYQHACISNHSGSPCRVDADCSEGLVCLPKSQKCTTQINTCLEDEDCTDDKVCDKQRWQCASNTPGASCQQDTDCYGMVCDQQKCAYQTVGDFCEKNADCLSTQICDQQKCITNTPGGTCRNDEDCLGDMVCDQQKCVSSTPGANCHTDEDCLGDLVCDQQKCATQTIGSTCSVNENCLSTQVCEQQTCITNTPGGICRNDDDCLGTMVCKQQKCVSSTPGGACRNDEDCLGDMVCKQQKCVSQSSDSTCRTDEDCDGDLVCDQRTCLPQTDGSSCRVDTDCLSNQICHEHKCETKTCSADTDCPLGTFCVSDVCKPMKDCQSDTECGNAFCVDQACCATELVCGETCCGTGAVCINDTCVSQCLAGQHACLKTNVATPTLICCESDELCLYDSCIQPGAPCNDNYSCNEDEYCELSSHVCLPKPQDTSDCETDDLPSGGSFEPNLLFYWGDGELAPGGAFPDHTNVIMAPMVADINDDGTPEIVFNSWLKNSMNWEDNGVLRIISGKDGTLLHSSNADLMTDPSSQVAIGRIYPQNVTSYNGVDVTGMQIITCSEDNHLVAFNNRAELIWKSADNSGECKTTGMGLVDFDGDGLPEIHARYKVYNARTGALIAGVESDGSSGSNYAIAADINDDGKPELIGGNVVYQVDMTAGTLIPIYQRTDQPDGFPAIADLDLDGKPEIVSVRKQKYEGTEMDALSHTVMAFKHDLTNFWSTPVDVHLGTLDDWGGGPATIARIDEDTHPSVMLSSGTHYQALNYLGEHKWSHEIQDRSSRSTGSAVFDFNGDGKAEILYGDEWFLHVYDGQTGDTVFCLCNSSATLYEYPVVADVNNDGHAEIVIASNRTAENKNCPGSPQYYKGETDSCIQALMDGSYLKRKGTTGVRVYSGDQTVEETKVPSKWMPTRSIYNQHAYSVTNILDDGSIPTQARPNWKTSGLNNFRLNTLPDAKAYQTHFEIYGATISTSHICHAKQPINFSVHNIGQSPIPAGTVIQIEVRAHASDADPLHTYYVETAQDIPVGKSAPLQVEIDMASPVNQLVVNFIATDSDTCHIGNSSPYVYYQYTLNCNW